MIVFVHTKFGLVQIQGNEAKRGEDSAPPPGLSEFLWVNFCSNFGCSQG